MIDAIHLLGIAHCRRVGERIVFRVEREGRVLELAGRAPPLPIEPGAEVGEIAVHGHRLRTPSNGDLERDAILYVQDIRPRSVEHPLHSERSIVPSVDGWARGGLHVLRIERAGVGDSEGPSCATTGLDFELDTYIAAIDSLRERAERVFLFGQSLGAMTAPLPRPRAPGRGSDRVRRVGGALGRVRREHDPSTASNAVQTGGRSGKSD